MYRDLYTCGIYGVSGPFGQPHSEPINDAISHPVNKVWGCLPGVNAHVCMCSGPNRVNSQWPRMAGQLVLCWRDVSWRVGELKN